MTSKAIYNHLTSKISADIENQRDDILLLFLHSLNSIIENPKGILKRHISIENFDYFNFVDVLRKCESAKLEESQETCFIEFSIYAFDGNQNLEKNILVNYCPLSSSVGLVDTISNAVVNEIDLDRPSIEQFVLQQLLYPVGNEADTSGCIIVQVFNYFVTLLVDCSTLIEVHVCKCN